jgi:imidazoleglycerol-phosphate dehydratase
MMARIAEVERTTAETSVRINFNLDGRGDVKLDYPIGFVSHVIKTFARYGLFDIEIRAHGDLDVDQHHLVEDTGLVLGECFSKALGDKRGIYRVGHCLFPMDEALARAVVDISGRPFLFFEGHIQETSFVSAPVPGQGTASFQSDTVQDFWQAFVSTAGVTMHLDIIRGRSAHHKIEALFKAAGRALRQACEIDHRAPGVIPSTKGVIA